MARKRVSMREGPLAELFRATEAAQDKGKGGSTRGKHSQPDPAPTEILSVVPDPAPEVAPTLVVGSRARRSSFRSPGGSSRCPSIRRASSARATAPRTSP